MRSRIRNHCTSQLQMMSNFNTECESFISKKNPSVKKESVSPKKQKPEPVTQTIKLDKPGGRLKTIQCT